MKSVLLPRAETIFRRHILIPLRIIAGDLTFPGENCTISEVADRVCTNRWVPVAVDG